MMAEAKDVAGAGMEIAPKIGEIRQFIGRGDAQ